MTGGGRVARLVGGLLPGRARAPARPPAPRHRRRPRPVPVRLSVGHLGPFERGLRPYWNRLLTVAVNLPRGFGVVASALIIGSAIAYGTVRGGHLPEVVEHFKTARDMAANAVGLRIASVALSGNGHLTRDEVLAAAGVTGRSSLLFIDVADARVRLKTNPWIAEATVQKLYPDRLQITITERQAFALWQKDGRVGVIADDGTVLEPYVSRRFTGLPLFVGDGAAPVAKSFALMLDRYPVIRDEVRAAVLVAERRWNLRLRNGIDIRLPEADADKALEALVALERDKKILSRDIVAIDLRLPDRVIVRLSDQAAAARDEANKAKKAKPKPGNA